MKLMMKLAVVTIALASNYLLGWTYEGEEQTLPRQDSVSVAASHRYSRMNPIKWFFLGKNYRKEWATPVLMPVFHLNETKGGFKIERLGGGEQTKSLHLEQKDGREWVLRSVDKNVRLALPEKLQGTFIENLVQDQISAAYPYAMLTMHDLAEAVDIPTPTAELYFVADDPALGKYRALFAHTVCFLSPKDIDGEDLETEDTDSIRTLTDATNHYLLDQEKILTVRLFDMLIADWDRHKGQWDWAFTDSAHTVYVYPVPEDRDQAYFLSTGALTQISRLFGLAHLVGFREEPKKLIKLNKKVHQFDRDYMNSLDRAHWERSIRNFQANMSDRVIENAVGKLPPAIYGISGKTVENKLKGRRNGLLKEGLKYYDFLAKEVSIRSTKDPELFQIQHHADSTTVTVQRMTDKRLIYRRRFLPEETRSVTLAGITGADRIEQSGNPEIRINIERKDTEE